MTRPRSTRKRHGALLGTLAAALLGACVSLSTVSDAGEYVTLDSGLIGLPDAKPYWISDEELLYAAQTDETRFNVTSKQPHPVYRVTLWNVRTNQIRRLHEMTGSLCYKDGYILTYRIDFGKAPDAPVERTYGRLGEPLTREEGYPGSTPRFDLHTCRPKSESLPAKPLPEWAKGKTVKVLEAIGGILVLDGEKENSDRNVAVTFHPNGRKEGVTMPFKRREMDVRGYHSFKQAYLIVAEYFRPDPRHPNGGYNVSPPPKGWVHNVWWLYRDGHIDQSGLVPNERRSWASILPYRNGYLWYGDGAAGEALYQADTTSDIPILQGAIGQRSVSPDGCRIAMNHRRSINDPWTTGTLKVIELCKGERK